MSDKGRSAGTEATGAVTPEADDDDLDIEIVGEDEPELPEGEEPVEVTAKPEPEPEAEAEAEAEEEPEGGDRYRLEHSRRRKAERERDAYARRLVEMDERLARLEGSQDQNQLAQAEATVGQLDVAIEKLRAERRQALDDSDHEAETKAEDRLFKLRVQREEMVRRVARQKLIRQNGGRQPEARAEPEPERELTTQAAAWMEKNKGWFDPELGNDASLLAYRTSERLTREGYAHDDPKHFELMDKELRKRFPENYRSTAKPTGAAGGSRGGGQERGNGRQVVQLPRGLVNNFKAAGFDVTKPDVKRKMVAAYRETKASQGVTV